MGDVCHQALAVNGTKLSPTGQTCHEDVRSLRNTTQIRIKKASSSNQIFILKREMSSSTPRGCRAAPAPWRYSRVARWHGQVCTALSHLLPRFCTHWSASGARKKSLPIPTLALGDTHLALDLPARVVVGNTESQGWISPCISYFWPEWWSSVPRGLHPCKYGFSVLPTITTVVTVLGFCFGLKALQRAAESGGAVIFNSKV